MKKITYIILLTLFAFTSCQKDVLNKQPLNIITDAVVWNDQTLIDAYLTQTYNDSHFLTNEEGIQDWMNATEYWFGELFINEVSDECKAQWIYDAYNFKLGKLKIQGGLLEWWEPSYSVIRKLNEFIERVPTAPVDNAFRKERTAEARFLRAFNYFTLVKRYGGVPLIIKSQNLSDPKNVLYPVRNKEQEVYDFIISEMDSVVNVLPAQQDANNTGRPNKYAAISLQCRAALYAGSISEFGNVQLSGIVGVDPTKSTAYYQKAYDAAKVVINSGKFALYNKVADKTTNFRSLFLDKSANPEVIFSILHNSIPRESGGHGWAYDYFQAPYPNAWGLGNQDGPYLEMAEEFEKTDGSSGKLDRTLIQQGLWTTDQLWKNKDPRFFASIYTQNTMWKGKLLDFHKGIILPDGSIKTDASYNGLLANGTQRIDGTGFGVLKYLDESNDLSQYSGTSQTDYQVFRYGETLLNFAEAAFELGKTSESLDAINQIRSRAGIALLTTIDRTKIRHERKVELAFEGHRYWDVRRWRTAEQDLSVNGSGLQFITDYTTGKYKLEVINNIDGTVSPPAFYTQNYYLPITLTRTGSNPNLVENPGY
jgi:hypothetical protein